MLDKTKCEGCGATGGVLIIDADGTLCSKCRQPKAEIRDNTVSPDCSIAFEVEGGAIFVGSAEPAPGSIVRLRAAVTAFYGSDEAEPAPDVLEAREVELDQALRFWLLAGMPS